MTDKNFFKVTGVIFTLVTIIHLLRVIRGWDFTIGGWLVPVWLSVLAVIFAGYLAYTALGKKD